MARQEIQGAAVKSALTGALSNTAMSFDLDAVTNWPTGAARPFIVTIGRGTATEERVLCLSRSGKTVTVAPGGRGYDGLAAQTHAVGTTVEHGLSGVLVDDFGGHAYDTGRDDHGQYILANGTRAFTGGSAITGAPASSAQGDAQAAGTANTLARSDHVHARETFGSPSASAPGNAQSAGSGTSVARSDHVHEREGFGSPAGSFVQSVAFDGAAQSVARSDHVHPRESFGNVTAQTSYGAAAANGSATSVARSDHAHGTPAHVHPFDDLKQASHVDPISTTSAVYGLGIGGVNIGVQSVNVPASGRVLVTLGCRLVGETAGTTALCSFSMSGANTAGGDDSRAIGVDGTGSASLSRMVLLTGLNPGLTHFDMVYRSAPGGTIAQFINRSISVIPL